MAKFKFRLATLMKLREQTRDERRAALAEAYQADQMLDGRLQELRDEVDGLKQQCVQIGSPGAVHVDRLIDVQRYEGVLFAEMKVIVQQKLMLAEEIERRRKALTAADREVRVLEKLQERQQQRHRIDEERRQQKELDEIAGRVRALEEELPCHD